MQLFAINADLLKGFPPSQLVRNTERKDVKELKYNYLFISGSQSKC